MKKIRKINMRALTTYLYNERWPTRPKLSVLTEERISDFNNLTETVKVCE